MSTVKISQLPLITSLNANTSNTLFAGVDLQSGITGKMSATVLAQGLYSHNSLNVGNNAVILPNITAQFAGTSDNYLQINLQNNSGNGSADMVITADVGNDSSYYIDLGLNGSTYDYAGYTYAKPLDGYLVVQGLTANSPGGNLVIGTTTPNKTTYFLAGSIDSSNIVASIDKTSLRLLEVPLIFADGSSQNTAAATITYSQASYAKANAAYASQNISAVFANASYSAQNTTAVFANSAFSTANAAGVYANGAYSVANTAVQNTAVIQIQSLTLSGNLIANSAGHGIFVDTVYSNVAAINNNLSVTGGITVNNNTFLANSQAMAITGSAGFARQSPAADGYMLHITGKDAVPSKVVVDAYGANTYALYTGRQARGTAAAPTATQSGDVIARYSSSSYSSGNTGFLPLGVGRMDFMASENHTDTNRGTQITFYSVNNGSNTLTQTAQFNGNTAAFPGTITANNIVLTGSLTANALAGQVFFANISIGSSSANTVQFYPSANAPAQMAGQLWYKSDVQTLVLDTDITNDRPGLGRVIYERVYNGTGSTIGANTVVRMQGSVTGNSIPYISLASANTATESDVLGIVKNAIANGAYGYSYSAGIIEDINTSAFANGAIVFLSSTPGQMTTVAPVSSTLATIQLGKILAGGTTTGKMQVDILPRPEYGKANGSILFANNNLSVASANVVINESLGTLSIANGLQNTMRPLAGNQTAFNINFTTDTVVRANISGSNLAITPTNFLAGKEVKVWVTNIAGGNRVITHGCSAVNATGGATTYTLPANATMFLRYMSFDGDLANTVVSATF